MIPGSKKSEEAQARGAARSRLVPVPQASQVGERRAPRTSRDRTSMSAFGRKPEALTSVVGRVLEDSGRHVGDV